MHLSEARRRNILELVVVFSLIVALIGFVEIISPSGFFAVNNDPIVQTCRNVGFNASIVPECEKFKPSLLVNPHNPLIEIPVFLIGASIVWAVFQYFTVVKHPKEEQHD